MEEHKLIKLSILNGKYLTFNADDYMKIRTEHRIIGKLIGIPVTNPRNVAVNGLPAVYTNCQIKLLLEKGIVELTDSGALKELPTDLNKESYLAHKRKVAKDVEKPYIESRLEVTKAHMDAIIRGKISKLVESGISENDIIVTPEQVLKAETERIQKSMTSNNRVYTQIPTQHAFSVASKNVSSNSVPSSTKYKVFKDLWMKGFFITTGDSFGGDFLTYPGDPMYYHASQIIHVVNSSSQLELSFLMSCARLSVSVNKKCVFAYAKSEDDEEITYQTLHWNNPKLRQQYLDASENTQNRNMIDDELINLS